MDHSNYDKQTGLSWFRKLENHPDLGQKRLAEDYCKSVADELGIKPPPRIFWFEEAEAQKASAAWLAYRKHEGTECDPLKQSGEYFRWRGKLCFAGYTHREKPCGIMINVCRRDHDLLRTVAHELHHLSQDSKHGEGWRAQYPNQAENESRKFEAEKAGEIEQFIARANADVKGLPPEELL